MPRPAHSWLLAAAAVLLVCGCGSSGPSLPADIPAVNAQGLNAYLVRAEQACKLQDAAGLRDAARGYAAAVGDLPSTVDPQVVTVLRKGADNLNTLARTGEGCNFGASGASGLFGAKPTTSTQVASTPAPPPTPAPKPKPKPKPKPTPTPTPAASSSAPGQGGATRQAPSPPASGNQGGGGNPSGGNANPGGGNSGGGGNGSGGVGVGPAGKAAKAGR